VSLLALTITFGALSSANARENNYLQLIYSTILNPVITSGSANRTVDFVSYFVTSGYKPASSDLNCRDQMTNKDPIISEIAPNSFSILCRFEYDSSTQAGIWPVSLSAKNSNTSIVPANAKNSKDVPERDNFGQIAKVNYLAYEIFSRGALLATANVVVNPPASFSYPDFQKDSQAYVLFDARESEQKAMKITLNKKKKTVSLSCPEVVLPSSLAKYTKVYTTQISDKDNLIPTINLNTRQVTYPYTGSIFQGKKLKLSCMYFVGMKEPYAGQQLRYFESKVSDITFPKN
jgi:hypothetical protein